MDIRFMLESFPKLLSVLPLTLGITFAAMALGLVLGLVFTLAKISRFRILSGATYFVTNIIRGIPTIVLLFLSYFGLPALFLLFGLDINGWNKVQFAIIALMLEIAATASELFRSAWLAIDRGQIDAAKSIGMNAVQTFRRIIASQALRVVTPNLGNLLISQFQNTSLVYTLGIIDIVGKVSILNTLIFGGKTLELYVTAAVIYWCVCLIFAWGFRVMEHRLNRGILVVR